MRVKRILSIILVVCFLLVSFSFGSAAANDTQGPAVTNVAVQIVSYSEFIKALAESRGISILSAQRYDASMTRNFEKMHPDLFGSASTNGTGHYEYPYYSRTISFGYSYGGRSINITQTVPTKVYVDGSFRQFVYVQTPYTQPEVGNYTWVSSYNHAELNTPTQFTALSTGYTEVAINSSLSLSIGVELKGNGFNFALTSGTTMYYRKSCTFPTWTYSLY